MASDYEPMVISKPCMARGASASGHKAWFWDYLGLIYSLHHASKSSKHKYNDNLLAIQITVANEGFKVDASGREILPRLNVVD